MMKLRKKQSASRPNGKGSALVAVVVLTVLLAAIGTLFVMASRLSQASTASIADNKDLQSGVETVLAKIKTVLTDDLFGKDGKMVNNDGGSDEPYDHPGQNDPWLASIEPKIDNNGTPLDLSDDIYAWPRITDLYNNNFGVPALPPPALPYYDPQYDTDPTEWDPTSSHIVQPNNVWAKIIGDNDRVYVIQENAPDWSGEYLFPAGARADADGDGVADSRWVRLPGMTGSKGQPVFAAVRIIDNCAMLNLNTAHSISADEEKENGKYLSSVDYERFLRGDDRLFPDRIRLARDPGKRSNTAELYHNNVVMNIEDPNVEYSPFDIGDELEIRNRYLLTSQVIARFEREDLVATPEDEAVAYDTFDFGRGEFVGGWNPELRVKRIPFDDDSFEGWKWRMDPCNFDENSGGIEEDAYKYDRRHVCTFYSFVRNIRSPYPFVDITNDLVDRDIEDTILASAGDVFIPYRGVADIRGISSKTIESRKKILHLLYAFRAYFLTRYPTENYKQAAHRAAQVVANMIDYIDDNNPATEGPFFDPPYSQSNEDLTFIDRRLIRFLISEVSGGTIDIGDPAPATLSQYEFGLGVDDPDETVYGYERQPFISEIAYTYSGAFIDSFDVELCNPYINPNGEIDLDGWRITAGTVTQSLTGQSILAASSSSADGLERLEVSIGSPDAINFNNIVKLERPDPAGTAGTDFITVDKTLPEQILTTDNVSQRNDDNWGFANIDSINGSDPNGFQMPVANNNEDLATLLDLERVLFIGNEKGGTDPNTITVGIAAASDESEIRFDIDKDPELLGFVSLLNRDEGTLPGRININTATMEVIRAAIPPVDSWSPDCNDLAPAIADGGPYNDLGDLLNIAGFNQFADASQPGADEPGIDDDAAMENDFEERDWILSRVANIFTTRSDVFTAYILVRLGVDGPQQKRMIAILDRSGVRRPSDKPKIVALHPVSDPR